jgi:Ni/Fe-hydrogenase 1 B-type cytochrome subunit
MSSTSSNMHAVPAKSVPVFNGMHSVAIRVWHWMSAAVIFGSIITVVLASTLFRTRNTISLVHDELQGKGAVVSQDQARAVAHAFNDLLWDLHKYIGFGLCALVLFRIGIEVMASPEKKLWVQLKKALWVKPADKEGKLEQQHYIQVKWIYVVFYAALILMALTGLGLAFEDVPFFKTYHGSIKQLHALLQWVIYGFIVMHITGVILADLGKYKGLVSGMIHGQHIKRDRL